MLSSSNTATAARCVKRCTTAANGRILRLTPHDAELAEARRARRHRDFTADYRRRRPMVERTIAWLVRPGPASATAASPQPIWLAHRAAA